MELLQTFSLVFVQDTTNVKAKKDTWGAFDMRYGHFVMFTQPKVPVSKHAQ